MRLGTLEAGGTKMVCAIGNEKGEIWEQVSIPTETPELTMPKLIAYFQQYNIEALGISCFGPIDLDKESETYGYITSTPKLSWRNYNIVGIFKETLKIPIGFDTDVNGAVLSEVTWGALKGLDSGIYMTIGTGIGVGIYSEGKLLHNMLHPEAGHVFVNKHPCDSYKGKCPYHGACLEGLAAGPAIEERYGISAKELGDKAEVWELEAYYIAQAIIGYILTVSPKRIILGGGVMSQQQLFPLIRKEVERLLGGYLITKELEDINSYIVPAALQGNQGIMGGLQLALLART
jgi:Transcriptional regulator/sugar kinase